MDHPHLTRELLAAFVAGNVPPRQALEPIADHLLSLCPICREEYLAFRRCLPPPAPPPPSRIPVLAAAFGERLSRLETLRRRAERELRELRQLDPPIRTERVRRALQRFSSPVLADLLIDECQAMLHRGLPLEAASFADLAVAVLGRVTFRSWSLPLVHGLLARAIAHKANALRVAEDLRGAEVALRRALSIMGESPDPLVRAEISSIAASLRRDQRRFSESFQWLDRALIIYRQADERVLLVRTLIVKGLVHSESGDPEAAVATGRLALRLLGAEPHPELQAICIHNIACALVDAGRCEEARTVLREDSPSPAEAGSISALKSIWLRARIARGLGRPEEAEALLLDARDGFLDRRTYLDAALVALDLAFLYAGQGRRRELQALASNVGSSLRRQNVHREATASLVLAGLSGVLSTPGT